MCGEVPRPTDSSPWAQSLLPSTPLTHPVHHLLCILFHLLSRGPPWVCMSSGSMQRSSVGSRTWCGITLTTGTSPSLARLPQSSLRVACGKGSQGKQILLGSLLPLLAKSIPVACLYLPLRVLGKAGASAGRPPSHRINPLSLLTDFHEVYNLFLFLTIK